MERGAIGNLTHFPPHPTPPFKSVFLYFTENGMHGEDPTTVIYIVVPLSSGLFCLKESPFPSNIVRCVWEAPGLHTEQCGQAVGSGGEHFSPGLRPLPSFWGRGTAESLRMHKGSPPGSPLTREREPPRALCRRLQGPGPRGTRRGCTTGPTLARAGHGTGTSPTHRGAGHSCPGVIVLPGPGPPELPCVCSQPSWSLRGVRGWVGV